LASNTDAVSSDLRCVNKLYYHTYIYKNTQEKKPGFRKIKIKTPLIDTAHAQQGYHKKKSTHCIFVFESFSIHHDHPPQSHPTSDDNELVE